MKEAFTVSEIAKLVGLSRARFYHLRGSIFPEPLYSENGRPYYDKTLLEQCIEIKQTGLGANGEQFLFYERRGTKNIDVEELFECKKCGRDLPRQAFYVKNGKMIRPCKDCHSAYRKIYNEERSDKVKIVSKEWRNANPDKVKDYTLLKKYGLTLEKFEAMYDDQKGKCDICGESGGIGKHELVIDHNHTTGRVRALLCPNCNRGLGMFRENVMLLIAAAKYLQRQNEIDVNSDVG